MPNDLKTLEIPEELPLITLENGSRQWNRPIREQSVATEE